jgi:predicted  nucleic acid-binding Zn-ribbon protein
MESVPLAETCVDFTLGPIPASTSALLKDGGTCYGGAMALTLEELDRRLTKLERTQSDTTETLRWVVTKLARMQAVQDEQTLRLERLEEKVDALPRAIAELIAASEQRIMAAIAER